MQKEINHKDDISFDQCIFKPERRKIAEFLTDYLSKKKDGYVLNLDGEWGSGKSFFIKSWHALIKDKHPVCYIDAWKTDFSKEPLLVIIHGIITSLNAQEALGSGIEYEVEKEFVKKTLALIGYVSKVSAPLVNVVLPGASVVTDVVGDGLNKLSNSIEGKYENYEKSLSGLDGFKSEINELLENIISSTRDIEGPLFIFLDELDRCRPSYAVEILETIKHLFDCKNIVFVIATNRKELEASIGNLYGSGFNSNQYLSRFFDRSSQLPSPDLEVYLSNKKLLPESVKYLNDYCVGAVTEKYLIPHTAKITGMQLRQADKIYDQLDSCLLYFKNNNRFIHPVVVMLALCIKEKNRELYEKMIFSREFMLLIIERLELKDTGLECLHGSLNFNNYIISLLKQANDLNELYYNEDADTSSIMEKWRRKEETSVSGANRANAISERYISEQFSSVFQEKRYEKKFVVSLSELKEVVEMAHIS